jgi:hypothetical protein
VGLRASARVTDAVSARRHEWLLIVSLTVVLYYPPVRANGRIGARLWRVARVCP